MSDSRPHDQDGADEAAKDRMGGEPLPQFAQIAEQFLDLWQEQLTHLSSDDQTSATLVKLWQGFLNDAKPLDSALASSFAAPAGLSGVNPFAAAPAPSSYDPVHLVPQLLARIAAMEARLAALESRLNDAGKPTAR
ncbi:MAG: hypothetical protein QM523_04965 [Candidatus Pacebacteria bacterium]|nr:hypothetical protein [Candidatus Paceibacterota bacterium]